MLITSGEGYVFMCESLFGFWKLVFDFKVLNTAQAPNYPFLVDVITNAQTIYEAFW